MPHTPYRLLIVDGHQGVREALAAALRRAPAVGDVEVAATLQIAVESARQHRPDVVLCDPKTVAGGADELVCRLSSTGAPVIVLTPSLGEGEEDTLRRAGAQAVLLKGLPLPTLLNEITTVMAGGSSVH